MRYRASKGDCEACPLKPHCCPNAPARFQQKRVTLPMDFRPPPENGHSRYGHLTARFAPLRNLAGLTSGDTGGLFDDLVGAGEQG